MQYTRRRERVRAISKQNDGETDCVVCVGSEWESGDSYHVAVAETRLSRARNSSSKTTFGNDAFFVSVIALGDERSPPCATSNRSSCHAVARGFQSNGFVLAALRAASPGPPINSNLLLEGKVPRTLSLSLWCSIDSRYLYLVLNSCKHAFAAFKGLECVSVVAVTFGFIIGVFIPGTMF